MAAIGIVMITVITTHPLSSSSFFRWSSFATIVDTWNSSHVKFARMSVEHIDQITDAARNCK